MAIETEAKSKTDGPHYKVIGTRRCVTTAPTR